MRLGLGGDTMLGRGVAERLGRDPTWHLFSPGLVAAAGEADLLVVNLECAVSSRGRRWPDPAKPFFFRAPPRAAEALAGFGVDCVTLANNHALDYGPDALLDTLEHLAAAGVAAVGAGPDVAAARSPVVLERESFRLGVVGVTDHPRDYAAAAQRPGVAYADLRHEGTPAWLTSCVSTLVEQVDLVLVTPHWGPNLAQAPLPHVRRAAAALRRAGAGVVAGHSAHVFHGVQDAVVYDLGELVDDYAVHPSLRNDLGVFVLVDVDRAGPVRLEALPLRLEVGHTRLATGDDASWVRRRFTGACAELGTDVVVEGGRLVVTWPRPTG